MRKKIVVISMCFSVSFVIVMLFLFHREEPKPKVKPTTDEIADVLGQPQRFERNEDSFRSKVGGNQENSDTVTTGATPFEVTTPDVVKPVVTPSEANDSVSEAEDEEFEAQWKEFKALVKERYGKDIEEIEAEYYADLRSRVDESVAQIEPLLEDIAFYKPQLEPLKRQASKHEEKWNDFFAAYKKVREAQRNLYVLYVFLSHEAAASSFGDLYLSTTEYAKLKTFAEDWYARQRKGIVEKVDGVWRIVE